MASCYPRALWEPNWCNNQRANGQDEARASWLYAQAASKIHPILHPSTTGSSLRASPSPALSCREGVYPLGTFWMWGERVKLPFVELPEQPAAAAAASLQRSRVHVPEHSRGRGVQNARIGACGRAADSGGKHGDGCVFAVCE